MSETLAGARPEDDHIGSFLLYLGKVIGAQLLERFRRPRLGRLFGHDDQTVLKPYRVDFDAIVVICSDGLVMLGRGSMQLHAGIDTRDRINFRECRRLVVIVASSVQKRLLIR